MSRWLLLAFGVGGLIYLLAGSSPRPRRRGLGSPIESTTTPRVTPNGHFGAHRRGPPIHQHQGVDLQARPGSHVLAIGDGTIVSTRPGLGGVVRKLLLDKPSSWIANASAKVHAVVYADLGAPLVEPGERVERGDPIALVWDRGFVHFAVKEQRDGRETFFDPADAGFAYRLARREVA